MNYKMKRFYPQYIIISLILSVVFIACKDNITENDIDNTIIPKENVSYSQYIQPVLTLHCDTYECHDDGTRAGDYSVTNWANVAYPGIVDPGNVETSRLVWRIEGLGVPIMPPIGARVLPLNKNQVEGIKTWIREGAKNN